MVTPQIKGSERDGICSENRSARLGIAVRLINRNPYLFHTGRVPLVIEGGLLIVLGVWGLVTNPSAARRISSMSPVRDSA